LRSRLPKSGPEDAPHVETRRRLCVVAQRHAAWLSHAGLDRDCGLEICRRRMIERARSSGRVFETQLHLTTGSMKMRSTRAELAQEGGTHAPDARHRRKLADCRAGCIDLCGR
jgi:hypothetical protein